MLRVLEETLIADLRKIIMDRVPTEAVGLILPNNTVVELPNRSLHPHDSFSVNRSDVVQELQVHKLPLSAETLEGCTLWHSHPSGGVGPSRVDMRNRPKLMSNLVLAVIGEGELIPSWY